MYVYIYVYICLCLYMHTYMYRSISTYFEIKILFKCFPAPHPTINEMLHQQVASLQSVSWQRDRESRSQTVTLCMIYRCLMSRVSLNAHRTYVTSKTVTLCRHHTPTARAAEVAATRDREKGRKSGREREKGRKSEREREKGRKSEREREKERERQREKECEREREKERERQQEKERARERVREK